MHFRQMNRYFVLLTLLLVALAIAGCSLFDEFDSGPENRRPMRDRVECYRTFSAAKKALHAAGKPRLPDHQWHHIVNQNPRNKARFGQRDLHCSDNLVYIPADRHRLISAHYQSKTRESKEQRVFEWLAEKSFEWQYAYGLEVLRRYELDFAHHGVDP